jgi:hypothetical protein
MASDIIPIVTTFTSPNPIKSKPPTRGPTLARAMGKARTAAPTVSVRVKEKAVQNGGRESIRPANLEKAQRNLSTRRGDSRYIEANGRL